MINKESTKPSKKWGCGCLGSTLLFLFGVPLLILGGTVGMLMIRESSAKRQLNRELQKLVDAGKPVDNRSISRFYDEHASAEKVQEWKSLLGVLGSREFQQSAQGIGPWNEETPDPMEHGEWMDEETTQNFLSQWKAARETALKLALEDRPVRFPIRVDSINTLLPEVQEMRTVARLLQLESHVAQRDRHSARIRDAILALLGASRTLEGLPVLVSELSRIAIEQMALGELQRAVEWDLLESSDLKAIAQRIQGRTPMSRSWRLAIQSERGLMLPIFSDGRYNGAPMTGGPPLPRLPARSKDALAFLQLMDYAEEAPAEDLDRFLTHLRSWEEQSRSLMTTGVISRFDHLLTLQTLPPLQSAGDAYSQGELKMRLAELAIEIRLFENDRGKLPDRLDELPSSGDLLKRLKPIGSKPFGYSNDERSAVLWGFNLRKYSETPETLPEVGAGYNEGQIWIWKFRIVE